MITLATPIAIPNLTKCRIVWAHIDGDLGLLQAQVEVGTAAAGGKVYATFLLEARDGGTSNGVRAKSPPTSYADFVEGFSTTLLPTGFTDGAAAYRSGASHAAGIRALETWAQGVGLLPAGTVT